MSIIEELKNKAMSLPGKQRAQLAESLVQSLENETIEQVWITEVKKRRDEVRQGNVKPISGEAALSKIDQLIK